MKAGHTVSVSRPRQGFVLLTTLWVLVGAGALALAVAVVARQSSNLAGNRAALARSRWSAEECVAYVRLTLEMQLNETGDAAWHGADRAVAADGRVPGVCEARLRPAGTRLDVNSASRDMLIKVFLGLGLTTARADSLVDALLDWRDPDDVAREFGAEERWYGERRRSRPRNGPLQHVRELRLIRGFEDLSGIDSLLDVEPGRLLLDRAPLLVLRALPGLDDEAVHVILRERLASATALDLSLLGHRLPPASRALLARAHAELSPLVVPSPDAWILEVRGRSPAGARQLTTVMELRLVRAGHRAAIARRRVWIE